MKKLLLSALLLVLPLRLHAAIIDEDVLREKTVTLHYSTTVAAGNAVPNLYSIDLISLSTTSSIFPHTIINPTDVGEIDISHIRVDVDKVAASSGSVKIGVFTLVSPTTSSVTFFWTRSFTKNISNTEPSPTINQAPTFYRCKVRNAATSSLTLVTGTTPWIMSNDTRNATFIYNSTTTIVSPISSGAVFPKVGDIVMEVTNNDALTSFVLNVELMYHAEP